MILYLVLIWMLRGPNIKKDKTRLCPKSASGVIFIVGYVQPRESKLRTEDDAQAHKSSSFSNHNLKFRATFMSLSVIFPPEL